MTRSSQSQSDGGFARLRASRQFESLSTLLYVQMIALSIDLPSRLKRQHSPARVPGSGAADR